VNDPELFGALGRTVTFAFCLNGDTQRLPPAGLFLTVDPPLIEDLNSGVDGSRLPIPLGGLADLLLINFEDFDPVA